METLRLNVGGVIFETPRTTIKAISDWKLADDQYLDSCYRQKENDYYFDRDPVMFSAILNFLRTSHLHLPTTCCGPFVKTELEFWEISPHDIEQCCWTNYNKWAASLEALAKQDKDTSQFASTPVTPDGKHHKTFWDNHRAQVWRCLNSNNSSMLAKAYSIISLVVVVVSITILILSTTKYFKEDEKETTTTSPTTTTTPNSTNGCPTETTAPITEKYATKNPFLTALNIICLVFFILEYAARFIYSPHKRRFLLSFLSIIDILAIIPDFVELFVFKLNPGLVDNFNTVGYVTMLRILRILRIFRLIRHSTALRVLLNTLKASVSELLLLVWLLMIGVVFFASLIYVVEDQSDFESIPDGFWWAIVTMTTVGYGDMSPKTGWGKVIGSFCAMMGVLVIGFSVPSLVNNFMMYYSQMEFANIMEKKEKLKKKKMLEQEKENNMTNCTGEPKSVTTDL